MRDHAEASLAVLTSGRKSALLCLVILTFVTSLLVFASLAQAAPKSVIASFGSDSLSNSSGVAVNSSGAGAAESGEIYVVDNDGSQVQRFDAEGNFIAFFGTSGTQGGQFSFAGSTQIAIDQSDGSVYVADTGNNRIQKFSADGTFVWAIGLDVDSTGGAGVEICTIEADCQAAIAGSGDGELSAPQGIAVDPVTGKVYVVDTQNNRVQRFTPSGSYDIQFGAAGTDPGQFTSPTDIAVASTGDVYVLEPNTRVQKFTSIGEFDAVIGVSALSGGRPGELAVDTSTDHVLVGQFVVSFSPTLSFKEIVVELDPGGTMVDIHAGGGGVTSGTGLAVNSNNSRIYLAGSKQFGGPANFVFVIDLSPPDVMAFDATGVGESSAIFNGRVNPKSLATTYHFEYGTTTSYGHQTDDVALGAGADPVEVSKKVSNLTPNTVYHYRLIATNQKGATPSLDHSFKTAAPTSSLGLPDGRRYELVSPLSKVVGATETSASLAGRSQSSSSGNAIVYASLANAGEGAAGGPLTSFLLSSRKASSWSTRSLNPKSSPLVVNGTTAFWDSFTEDLSKGVVSTYGPINAGDPKEVWNYYLRGLTSDTYQLINPPSATREPSTGKDLVFRASDPSLSHIVFATSFKLTEDTPSEWGPADVKNLYEWSNGQLHYIPYLPDPDGSGPLSEEPSLGFLAAEPGLDTVGYPGQNAVTSNESGSRIYFSERGVFPQTVYLRDRGVRTIEVAASQRGVPDPHGSANRQFELASADGSIAFFRSREKLTDDATAGGEDIDENGAADLYRYDVTTESLIDITTQDENGAGVFGTVGANHDATRIYFVATGDLASGAQLGHPNLYLWEEGHGVSFVATLADGHEFNSPDLGVWTDDAFTAYREARVTKDGRHLLFASHAQLTDYDNAGWSQLYRFSLGSSGETRELICVSCNQRTATSQGNVTLRPSGPMPPVFYLRRNLSSDGGRIFFDSLEALVPSDTNGKADVYEWAEGRVHLISSGTADLPSRFLDASSSGDDVFFVTNQQLVNSDLDPLNDVYDARVGGGFPEEQSPPDCNGDACQSPSSAPIDPSPSSSTSSGPGNAASERPRRRCARGKVKRRNRCVNRRTGHPKRTDRNGRAGR